MRMESESEFFHLGRKPPGDNQGDGWIGFDKSTIFLFLNIIGATIFISQDVWCFHLLGETRSDIS